MADGRTETRAREWPLFETKREDTLDDSYVRVHGASSDDFSARSGGRVGSMLPNRWKEDDLDEDNPYESETHRVPYEDVAQHTLESPPLPAMTYPNTWAMPPTVSSSNGSHMTAPFVHQVSGGRVVRDGGRGGGVAARSSASIITPVRGVSGGGTGASSGNGTAAARKGKTRRGRTKPMAPVHAGLKINPTPGMSSGRMPHMALTSGKISSALQRGGTGGGVAARIPLVNGRANPPEATVAAVRPAGRRQQHQQQQQSQLLTGPVRGGAPGGATVIPNAETRIKLRPELRHRQEGTPVSNGMREEAYGRKPRGYEGPEGKGSILLSFFDEQTIGQWHVPVDESIVNDVIGYLATTLLGEPTIRPRVFDIRGGAVAFGFSFCAASFADGYIRSEPSLVDEFGSTRTPNVAWIIVQIAKVLREGEGKASVFDKDVHIVADAFAQIGWENKESKMGRTFLECYKQLIEKARLVDALERSHSAAMMMGNGSSSGSSTHKEADDFSRSRRHHVEEEEERGKGSMNAHKDDERTTASTVHPPTPIITFTARERDTRSIPSGSVEHTMRPSPVPVPIPPTVVLSHVGRMSTPTTTTATTTTTAPANLPPLPSLYTPV